MSLPLVAIGDSLTQGFQSGAISKTRLSYPAMIAECLDHPFPNFKAPDFTGQGGIPINLEELLRSLSQSFGCHINLFELPFALLATNMFLNRVEDYWERGEGSQPSRTGPLHHNLAVWGFELADCDTLSSAVANEVISANPDNGFIMPLTDVPMYRSTRRTLNPSFAPTLEAKSQLDLLDHLVETHGEIENLIFFLGANNALGTVTRFEIRWSSPADVDKKAYSRMCTLWRTDDFKTLLDRIAPKIAVLQKAGKVRNVITATIPHVTIPPITRGINLDPKQKPNPYYDYYTYFFIWDASFRKDLKRGKPPKFLTGEQAKLIDAQIDTYNEIIEETAAANGWHVVQTCRILDSMAFRRLQGKTTYAFPPELIAAMKANPKTRFRFDRDGRPILDSRYLGEFPEETALDKRYRGGFFSLDGIHPTTIGYGIVAHEFMRTMETGAGVVFPRKLDWNRIIAADSLITSPPEILQSVENMLGALSAAGVLQKLQNLI